MDHITEYSKLCDLVYSVSCLNIKNEHISELHEDEYNELNYDDSNYHKNNKIINKQLKEMDNKYILHFQEEYSDIDKILSSFDLREYVIPYSSYLTNIINNYLMELMMRYMNFSVDEKSNITTLIKFYKFSVEYIGFYYSYQKQLEKLSSFPDERNELKLKAKLDMKNKLDYVKAYEIYDYLNSFKDAVYFSDNVDEEYETYTINSKKLIHPLQDLVKYLLSSMDNYIKDVNEFIKLNVNDRMDMMIPFMNIIQFLLYILVKNDDKLLE